MRGAMFAYGAQPMIPSIGTFDSEAGRITGQL